MYATFVGFNGKWYRDINIKIEYLITAYSKSKAKSLLPEIKSEFLGQMMKGETVRYSAEKAGIKSITIAIALALQQNIHLNFSKVKLDNRRIKWMK